MITVIWLSIKKPEDSEKKYLFTTFRIICDIKKQTFEIARKINKAKKVLKKSESISWKQIKKKTTKKETKFILDFEVIFKDQEEAFNSTDKVKDLQNFFLSQKVLSGF